MREHPKMLQENNDCARGLRVSYLVGGLRISLGDKSTTPGPRNHILNFVEGLRRQGCHVDLFVVSETKLLSRFSTIPEGGAGKKPKWKTILSDGVRIAAMLISGLTLSLQSTRQDSPDIIYERLAVMQSLSSFHRHKGSALRIVESNGIMSRETAKDRGALVLEPLARMIEIHAYRRADKIVTVSDALAEEVARFASIPRNRIVVIPNAIPFSLMVECPEPDMDQVNGVVIGFTGAVVEWQQLDLLLKAIAAVRNGPNMPPVTLEIIGEGPALAALKELASHLGIESSVVFHGSLSPVQVQERMRKWTVGYAGHKRSSGEKMYHSPLKLYEYAGVGLGALSTPSADAQSLGQSGMPLWIFEEEQGLREAIINLLSSVSELEAYKSSGYLKVWERHSWISRLDELCASIQSADARRPQRHRD